MAKSKVFRKVALERMSSPEQLDQLMRVTNPHGWLALGALIMLILAALGWGIFGSIPTEAAGEGILLRRGGVSELVANASGQVAEVRVAVGDVIAAGQVVATLRQELELRQIEDLEAKQRTQQEEYRDLERYAEEQTRLTAANLRQQRANLERSITTLERNNEILEDRISVQRALLEDGLITQQTLLATEQELNTGRDQAAEQRLELGGLELRRLETAQQLEQQLENRRGILRDLELELRELRATLRENASVVATGSGRVLELMVDRGDVIVPGTPILIMEEISDELMAVVFVPATLGKQVRAGMEARIVPSTVQREKHGFMLGEVVRVARFPSTSRGMARLLANEELVARLMIEGPPLQIDVQLKRDPTTPSGYRWSSLRGPELEISSGTLAAGSVIVREDRPIFLVIPQLRKNLGV